MPLYEYEWPNGHLVEVIHGMTEASAEVCEVCGVGALWKGRFYSYSGASQSGFRHMAVFFWHAVRAYIGGRVRYWKVTRVGRELRVRL